MKKLISLLFILGFVVAAKAATLTWVDPNPVEAGITGYRVVRWSGTEWVEVAVTTEKKWPIVLPVGKHRLAVVAFNQEVSAAKSDPRDFWLILAVTDLKIEQ